MAYRQPIESMAYNRWIYGHNDLKEQKKILVQKHISVVGGNGMFYRVREGQCHALLYQEFSGTVTPFSK